MALKGKAVVAVLTGTERQAARLYRRAAHLLSSTDAHQQVAESLGGAMLSEATLGKWDPQLAEDLYGLAERLGAERGCLGTLTEVFARLERASADEHVLVDAASVTLILAIQFATGHEQDHARVDELSRVIMGIANWTCLPGENDSRLRAIIDATERLGGIELAAAITPLLADARAALAEARASLPDASQEIGWCSSESAREARHDAHPRISPG